MFYNFVMLILKTVIDKSQLFCFFVLGKPCLRTFWLGSLSLWTITYLFNKNYYLCTYE